MWTNISDLDSQGSFDAFTKARASNELWGTHAICLFFLINDLPSFVLIFIICGIVHTLG